MSITEGIERTDEFRVEGLLLTDVEGTLPMAVLSTPGMISMTAARRLLARARRAPPGHATVGFEVRVKHIGGAFEGATAPSQRACARSSKTCKLRLRRQVRDEERTIGVGTHERRVVPISR